MSDGRERCRGEKGVRILPPKHKSVGTVHEPRRARKKDYAAFAGNLGWRPSLLMKGIAMNKPEGKLTLAVAKAFLLAILICIPLSATFCRAQCWNAIRSGNYPSMTMTPRFGPQDRATSLPFQIPIRPTVIFLRGNRGQAPRFLALSPSKGGGPRKAGRKTVASDK